MPGGHLQDAAEAAADELLGPLAERLLEDLDLEHDDEAALAVSRALTVAFMRGVRIGAAEIAAQTIEAGVNVRFELELIEP